jgi:FlaA1/EpsC-like NDP-sugar epimerase
LIWLEYDQVGWIYSDKEIEIQVVGLRPGRNYMKNYSTMLQIMPTGHNKIMMTQEIQDEFETFHSDINELISIAYLFDNDNIVSKMKKLYQNTMNSTFEILDK